MTRKLAIFAMLALCLQLALSDDLLFAVELTRPAYHYPKQELVEGSLGKGLHLAPSGMRQQYILGRELRKRFMDDTHLLNDRYIDRSQIYIRTNSHTQCITSAYAQLMGIYVPGSGDLLRAEQKTNAYPPNKYDYSAWTQELESAALNYTYQSVPLIETGGVPDYMLDPEGACPGVRTMIGYTYGAGYESRFYDLYKRLADAFKLTGDPTFNITYASELRDALIVSRAEGKPATGDDTTTKLLIDETLDIDISESYNYKLDIEYSGRNVSRIMATPLLRAISKHLFEAKESHLKKRNDTLKFAFYVSSRYVMQAVLQQLHYSSDKKIAPHSSVLLLELYKNATSNNGSDVDYYVGVNYNTEIKATIPYPEFVSVVESNTYTDTIFKSYCESYSRDDDSSSVNWILILIIAGSVVCLVLIGVLIFYLRMKCKSDTEDAAEEEQVLKTLKVQLGVKE